MPGLIWWFTFLESWSNPLPLSFYEAGAVSVARSLLGCTLCHTTPAGRLSGVITETEAYLSDDPASHSYRGPTARNSAMFGPAGHAYFYRSYGLHTCLNVVTGLQGVGEAVLIRSLRPLEGIAQMRKHRGTVPDYMLCNGPGKLCQALSLTLSLNNHPFTLPPLTIQKGSSHEEISLSILTGPRIGISRAKEVPLRFWLPTS